jgi:hypothetical protein
MTLGLSDKERREQVTNQVYNTNAIMFGEAKEGAMEAYNFSVNASITTIHATKNTDGKLVATAKTLAQSIFSVETGTSKVTDRDNKEDEPYNEAGKADEQVGHGKIAIKGMEIRRRGTEGGKEKMEMPDAELDSATKEAATNLLSSAMRKVTKDLQLNSNSDGVHNTEEEMVDPNTDDDDN